MTEEFKHQEDKYELGLGRPRARTYAIGNDRDLQRPFKGWLKVGNRSFKVMLCLFILCCTLPPTVEAAMEASTHTDWWLAVLLVAFVISEWSDDSDSDSNHGFWAGGNQLWKLMEPVNGTGRAVLGRDIG